MKKLSIKEFRSNESLVLGKDQMKMVMGGYISCQTTGDPYYLAFYRVQFWSCNNGDKFVTGSWLDDGEWQVQFDYQIAD